MQPTRAPLASLLGVGLAVLLPLPLMIFDGSIPLVRIYTLAAVSVAVALTEGAAGPVAMITGIFVAHAVVYSCLVTVLAKVGARAMRHLPAGVALAVIAAVLATGLGFALFTEPYLTPFGLTPRSNLLGVLS